MNASAPVTNELPDVLRDITTERARQIADGWTTEHDDRHMTHTLVTLAERYAHKADPQQTDRESGYYSRRRLVQAAALLVAAIEAMDRRER